MSSAISLRTPWRAGLASLVLTTTLVHAEGVPPGAGKEAGLEYRSAFESYRKFEDHPASSWREANDTVGRIGGWRAYAREAHQGGDASAPSTGGEAGHANRHGAAR